MSSIEQKMSQAASVIMEPTPWSFGTIDVPPHFLRTVYFDQSGTDTNLISLSPSATKESLDLLAASCQAASCGVGNQTVLDESYRKAGKMDKTQFCSWFDLQESGIISKAIPPLMRGSHSEKSITPELYKLNHKAASSRLIKTLLADPPCSPLWSLFSQLPHEGGQLVLRHNHQEFTFSANDLFQNCEGQNKVAYVAFFSDVEHEVLPVSRGHRVTLTYNIYYAENLISNAKAEIENLSQKLSALLDDPQFLPEGGFMGFGLHFSYPIHIGSSSFSSVMSRLKGADEMIATACSDLQLQPSIRAIMSEEDYLDEDGTLSYMVRKPLDLTVTGELGGGLREYFEDRTSEAEQVADQVCSLGESSSGTPVAWITPLTDETSYQTAYTAYGNEASTVTRYTRAALIAPVGPYEKRAKTK